MANPMGAGVAAALGAVQGLTEFLPVSSDGHLAIGALLFGVPDMSLTMVVVLHAGTLLATLLVFGGDLSRLTVDAVRGLSTPRVFLASEQGRIVAGMVVASAATAVVGLLLEKRVEAWSHQPWIVGVCLLGSAIAVLTTRWAGGQQHSLALSSSLILGIVQGLAVLPGLSRSGSTIAAGMLLGLAGPDAFRFSFLLSIPAVAGAVLLKLLEPGALNELGASAVIGAFVALVVGYGALLVLRRMVDRGRLWGFALYLVPVGLALIAWDLAS